MLRCYVCLGLFILTSQCLLHGQASAHRPAFEREGKTVIKLTPVNPGASLAQLVTGSDLIVDGMVTSAQPSFPGNPSNRHVVLETHAVVSVSAVLKGTLPKSSTNILVAQVGGRRGIVETEVEKDELLAEGCRYILFLQNDDSRTDVANNSGMRRYGVVGIWAGKVKILNGKVRFLSGVSPGLGKYNGLDSTSFMQEIKDLVAGRYIPGESAPASPLPPHPGPPSGRGQ